MQNGTWMLTAGIGVSVQKLVRLDSVVRRLVRCFGFFGRPPPRTFRGCAAAAESRLQGLLDDHPDSAADEADDARAEARDLGE